MLALIVGSHSLLALTQCWLTLTVGSDCWPPLTVGSRRWLSLSAGSDCWLSLTVGSHSVLAHTHCWLSLTGSHSPLAHNVGSHCWLSALAHTQCWLSSLALGVRPHCRFQWRQTICSQIRILSEWLTNWCNLVAFVSSGGTEFSCHELGTAAGLRNSRTELLETWVDKPSQRTIAGSSHLHRHLEFGSSCIITCGISRV